MREIFSRTERLLGKDAMEKLARAKVLLFGVGGVGSHAAEALVRSGIGHLTIVDNDEVCISNLNRQIEATQETIGQSKVLAMKNRLLSIHPDCDIKTVSEFYLSNEKSGLITDEYDYIIDAIDTVSAKIDICLTAQKKNIPLISCMGTGNKLHPEMLQIADLFDTSVCPLCRVMRSELKKRGVKALKVVYSPEPPISPQAEDPEDISSRRLTPGSTAFVPPAAGLLIASCVVQDLTK